MEFTLLTEQHINDGMSVMGGLSRLQCILVGIDWPPRAGWKQAAIGNTVELKDLERFLELRNEHIREGGMSKKDMRKEIMLVAQRKGIL